MTEHQFTRMGTQFWYYPTPIFTLLSQTIQDVVVDYYNDLNATKFYLDGEDLLIISPKLKLG